MFYTRDGISIDTKSYRSSGHCMLVRMRGHNAEGIASFSFLASCLAVLQYRRALRFRRNRLLMGVILRFSHMLCSMSKVHKWRFELRIFTMHGIDFVDVMQLFFRYKWVSDRLELNIPATSSIPLHVMKLLFNNSVVNRDCLYNSLDAIWW
jgi:hypothetical protein